MAINPYKRKPLKVLATLAGIFVVLAGLLVGSNVWGSGSYAPKLGLDLEGGTQIVLQPKLVGDQKVTAEQLDQARGIIVQRIDSNGVSGAEVTTRGGENIVVSMPGEPSKQDEDAIRRSSQMQFRGVLAEAPGTNQPVPTGTTSGTTTGKPTGTATGSATGTPKPSATASASTTGAGSAVPQAFVRSTTPPPTPAATKPSGTATTSAPNTGSSAPKDPNDLAWITPEISQQFQALDCAKPGVLDGLVNDPKKPLVTCGDNGNKYVLGPVIVGGDQIKNAQAGYQPLSNGQPSSTVEIQLSFKGEGTKAYADASKRMVSLPTPQNQMAAVLDNQVIVAPYFQSAILDGNASITGSFTIESARDLANQLKFGALPISFTLQTREQISPTLGTEQLRMGVIAGLVGLLLVGIYSLIQYRALGLVTLASIAIAGILTYLTITILGWSHNYRLDMAGVTGLVVAIGVTADSFIVYFERIRDEVREGRPLRAAVETGWRRARRTILVADGVNFLAAVVLYFLASSGVRGFAFTLGLTTLIDILIVFLFTHPLVGLLAETKFFGGGHKWSGLSPERLGAKVSPRYVGRGRFAAPAVSMAKGGAR
ncbi:protein translocase subunit SecD [Knoellia koreensis]|uniref:protein translocase subunit SecD n=1 Tax=Knoellia koreensis TaxID=2730921 RepID=UPI003211D085